MHGSWFAPRPAVTEKLLLGVGAARLTSRLSGHDRQEAVLLSADLIDTTARALAGHDPSGRSLDLLVKLMPQVLPGCRAASAARWRDGKAVEMAASDGSAADLLASELERGNGPTVEARRAGLVWGPHIAREDQWAGFQADALRAGIRSFVTLAQPDGAAVVTLSLFGLRPDALRPDTAALAWLFIGRGEVPAGGRRRSTATGGEPSRTSRSPAQAERRDAKQLLMRALGADEREARDLLRLMSHQERPDGEDLARWLIVEHMRAAARIGEAAREAGWQPPGIAAAAAAWQRSSGRAAAWAGQYREMTRTRSGAPAAAASAGPAPRQQARDGQQASDPRQPSDGRQRSDRRQSSESRQSDGTRQGTEAPAGRQAGPGRPAGGQRKAPAMAQEAYPEQLARLAEQAASMRRQLVGFATAIAQTELRLAETLDRSAEFRTQHADRLRARASEARRYSRDVRRLAREFSRDPGRGRRAPVPSSSATEDGG